MTATTTPMVPQISVTALSGRLARLSRIDGRLAPFAMRLARSVGAGVVLALVGTLLICLSIPVLCLLPMSAL